MMQMWSSEDNFQFYVHWCLPTYVCVKVFDLLELDLQIVCNVVAEN